MKSATEILRCGLASLIEGCGLALTQNFWIVLKGSELCVSVQIMRGLIWERSPDIHNWFGETVPNTRLIFAGGSVYHTIEVNCGVVLLYSCVGLNLDVFLVLFEESLSCSYLRL